MFAARPLVSTTTLALLAALAACLAFALTFDTAHADEGISISGTAYNPSDVTWTHNDGAVPHTVTASDGAFDSGTISDGETFAFTFEEDGTYDYSCVIHPSMTGTITVEAAAGNGDDPTPTTADPDPTATSADADPPGSGGDSIGSGSGVPWMLTLVGAGVVVVGAGLLAFRASRQS